MTNTAPYSSFNTSKKPCPLATCSTAVWAILMVLAVEGAEGHGFWDASQRAMARTPQGHSVAISCHNCYGNGNRTTSGALDRIRQAQLAGADLIELDVVSRDDDTISVAHGDPGGSIPLLKNVLADCALRLGDQSLFVEIKSDFKESQLEKLLDTLIAVPANPSCPYANDSPFVRPGRPIIIRAFHSRRNLLLEIDDLLGSTEFNEVRDLVMLSELYHRNQATLTNGFVFHDAISKARDDGFEMVEFDHRTKNLPGLVTYAKELGLGVNLFTFSSSFNEVFVAFWREEVDALTIDGLDQSANAKRAAVAEARMVAEADNELAHLNVWDHGGEFVRYHLYGSSTGVLPLEKPGSPEFHLSPAGEDLFGGYLQYNRDQKQSSRLLDLDNSAGDGYLVAAVVNFDDLDLAPKTTQAIVNKSDAGGFALELRRPETGPLVLRFGVHVDGQYRYAETPASTFNTTDAYILIGAYDGDGRVRLWVNHQQPSGSSSNVVKGGVRHNDSPVLIGADPQGCCDSRFHFTGKIQSVLILNWG